MRADDIRAMEAREQDLNARIREVEQAMEHADPKLRETFQHRLPELLEQRRGASEMLAQLRLEQAQSWMESDFATGVEAVLDNIGKRIWPVGKRPAH